MFGISKNLLPMLCITLQEQYSNTRATKKPSLALCPMALVAQL